MYGLIYLYSVLCLYLFIYGRCMHVNIGLFIYFRYFLYIKSYTLIYKEYIRKKRFIGKR